MGFQLGGTGWWERSKTAGTATFNCPNSDCKSHRQERKAELQRRHTKTWVTLIYIPVLPIADRGIHLRCGSCKTEFSYDALDKIAPDVRFP